MTSQAQAKAIAIDSLKAELKDGDTIHTVLRSVAASGMSRRIDLYVIRDNEPKYLTWLCVTAGIAGMSWRGKIHEGASINGCGMDMGFAAVDALANNIGCKLNHKWI